MMKWIFGLLLLVNVVFFSIMQWGGALTVDTNNPPIQPALNADKIKIVSMVVPSAPVATAHSAPVSAVSVASAVAMASSSPVIASNSKPATAAMPSPAKLSCLEWGEFSGPDLRRADNSLAVLKLGDRSKQRVVEYTSGYWIFIAPMKTHAQVKKKVAQLKKLNVEDYFVIQEAGTWKNSISLGMFKTEELAKKHLAKLQKQGVKSGKVGPRVSKLKFTVFALSRLDSSELSQVSALHKDFPDSEIKQVACADSRQTIDARQLTGEPEISKMPPSLKQ